MQRNFSESATVVVHRADGMAALPPGCLRGDVHGQPVYTNWGGSRAEYAVVQGFREDQRPRRRGFCWPEHGPQGAPGGAEPKRHADAFTKGFAVLRGTAAALFACVSVGLAGAAPVAADPAAAAGPTDPVTDVGPPPPVDDGRVGSTPPVSTKSPDGWTLTVAAHDETELSVPSLTDEAATREYVVGGIFTGAVRAPAGAGPPQGTFEVGYQIACRADLDTAPPAFLSGMIGVDPAAGEVNLSPGSVTIVPVARKEFKGNDPWVMISGFSIKIDGGMSALTGWEGNCIGQSFIRSYATLTASTDTSNVSQSYYGTTKVV